MEIYLAINNGSEVLQLPVLPDKFEVDYSYRNTTKSSITQGEMRLIGLKGLKTLSFSSFFPAVPYAFQRKKSAFDYKVDKTEIKLEQNNETYGWGYVKIIEEWMNKRIPIRVVITETLLNLAMTIDSFKYGIDDGTGDIKYTINLTEFKFIKLEERV